MFLNTRGGDEDWASPELIELLHYIESATGSLKPAIIGAKLKQIHQRVQSVRDSEATAEGLKAGARLNQVHLIRENLNQDMPVESIAAFLRLDIMTVKQIADKIQAEPDVTDEALTLCLPEG